MGKSSMMKDSGEKERKINKQIGKEKKLQKNITFGNEWLT